MLKQGLLLSNTEYCAIISHIFPYFSYIHSLHTYIHTYFQTQTHTHMHTSVSQICQHTAEYEKVNTNIRQHTQAHTRTHTHVVICVTYWLTWPYQSHIVQQKDEDWAPAHVPDNRTAVADCLQLIHLILVESSGSPFVECTVEQSPYCKWLV
jgi:hypothetical protein